MTTHFFLKNILAITALSAMGAGLIGCSDSNSAQEQTHPEYLLTSLTAGEATVTDATKFSRAFANPMPNLSEKNLELHNQGDANFERVFIQGPNSGHPEAEGLGPAFNTSACITCHGADGRGSLPILPAGQLRVKLGASESLLLRISVESESIAREEKTIANHFGAPRPVPGFGTQLFHRGVYGLRADSPGSGQADIWMTYRTHTISFPDGEVAELRVPQFEIANPYDAPGETSSANALSRIFQSDVRVSPRMGMPMAGLGLLEAIRDQDILALADPEDKDSDGISGRPNFVYDVIKDQKGDLWPVSIGRFGWKGSAPHLAQQAMAALNGDMGVTNFLFPNESIYGSALYDRAIDLGLIPSPLAPQTKKVEADDELAKSLIAYSRTLGVPARRNVSDPIVIRGGQIFQKIQCTSCHTPSFTTGAHADFPELGNQKIHPFTDFLLHDMGPELADGRRDFEASGQEWKTQALWGIGLNQSVNPRAGFLHDGRARNLQEAILFHGGEAQTSRQAYMDLKRDDRSALLAFLRSL